MTNEEAKKILDSSFVWQKMVDEECDALAMAIKALEQQPCDDTISRQEVLDAIQRLSIPEDMCVFEIMSHIGVAIATLPPVTPQPKTGKWIPIKTRPLTAEEREELGTDVAYMYDCPLPEDGEQVLITNYFGETTMDIFCRDSHDGCYFETYCDEEDVKAWMPLPEPYKEDCEGE